MSEGWPMVPLGAVVSHRKNFIEVDDAQTYKRCRVQLHAQGIVLRDQATGAEIKTKKQQVCQAGEFLVAEIDAKMGGFGIVPSELEGAVVSSHYFLFQVHEELLDPRFLGYYIRTPQFRDQVTAQGSTNYAAIRPSHVLGYTIPLPPLNEQRRIVARIEELAAKIEEARGLRRKAIEEAEALRHAYLRAILDDAPSHPNWRLVPIPAVAEVNPTRRGQVELEDSDVVSFVPMAAVDDVNGAIMRPEKKPLHEVRKGFTFFRNGDVIFARITPCMQNGKAALAGGLENGIGFGSTEFHVLRPGPKLLGRWLHCLVRHEDFRKDAAEHFTGTAGQQRVPQSFLEQKHISVPPIEEQARMVTFLDDLQVKVAALNHLQAETAAELNTLLPSLLDKAFKGEL